jgi:Ca2+-binding RTX toxin-like protein
MLINGTIGDDILVGISQNDSIYGGNGNDTINAGLEIDIVDGIINDNDLLIINYSIGDTGTGMQMSPSVVTASRYT